MRKELERKLERIGSIRNADVQIKTKDGALIDCLLSAETVVIHGQACVLSVMQDITERKRSEPRPGLQDHTARERDILALVCQGSGDREIAEKLGLSRNTIRNRIAAIYGKTDVHHRGALVVWARERGFTGDHPPGMGRASVRTNIR